MLSTLRVATPPATEPVDSTTARAHLRLDSDDGGLLALQIAAARSWVETFLGRVLITQTLRWTIAQGPATSAPGMGLVPLTAPSTLLAPGTLLVPPLGFAWPPRQPLEFPRSPVQSITSVVLGGLGEDDTTLTTSDYDADLSTDPARMQLKKGGRPFPLERLTITFVAGYGAAADVPAPIRQAILLLLGFLWENRGDAGGEMPPAAQHLLWPYRIAGFG